MKGPRSVGLSAERPHHLHSPPPSSRDHHALDCARSTRGGHSHPGLRAGAASDPEPARRRVPERGASPRLRNTKSARPVAARPGGSDLSRLHEAFEGQRHVFAEQAPSQTMTSRAHPPFMICRDQRSAWTKARTFPAGDAARSSGHVRLTRLVRRQSESASQDGAAK
jgi:hypothetical protein